MVAGEDHGRTTRTSPTEAATFALERFAWEAPDRLGVSGTFSGLAATPQSPPGLVVVGHEQTHLLAAIPGSVSGPPENGAPWAAEFAWQEPPVAFEAAVLTIGDDVVVDLPEPGAKRRWARTQTLHVRRAETPAARDGRERVRLEAELLAAQEEIRELRAALERAREDVTRAQQDLQGERDRHAADAERFREGLTRVRESAAEALAVEQRAAHEADAGLRAMRAAVERRDAALRKATLAVIST